MIPKRIGIEFRVYAHEKPTALPLGIVGKPGKLRNAGASTAVVLAAVGRVWLPVHLKCGQTELRCAASVNSTHWIVKN